MSNKVDVVVKKGDTLSSIANKYGTNVDKILEMNPNIKNPNLIVAGNTIVVPENVELVPNTELKTVIGVNAVDDNKKASINVHETNTEDMNNAINIKPNTKDNLEAKADKIEDQNTNDKKDVSLVAKEVMAGKWGNGDNRRDNLIKAGYDPNEIQKIVNEEFIMKNNYTPSIDPGMVINASNNTSIPSGWDGRTLNSYDGTVDGPSGKETYYNLSMKKIAKESQPGGWIYNEAFQNGFADNLSSNVWVRDDGVKMMGNYVMVAANLSVHPRGSLVATSLGMGVVVDTGKFAISNPNQIDIATTW